MFPIPASVLTPAEVDAANLYGIVIGLLTAVIVLTFAILFVVIRLRAEFNRNHPIKDYKDHVGEGWGGL